jgi:hypothetical protein
MDQLRTPHEGHEHLLEHFERQRAGAVRERQDEADDRDLWQADDVGERTRPFHVQGL